MTMNKKTTLGKNYYQQLKKLLDKSVCPLSGVAVSAILVTDKGVFSGVNYEDLVCSLSCCAERVAYYCGIVHDMRHIYEVHIMSPKNGMSMCGACRQLISTLASKDTKVYSYQLKTGRRTELTLGQLLPKAPLLPKRFK